MQWQTKVIKIFLFAENCEHNNLNADITDKYAENVTIQTFLTFNE